MKKENDNTQLCLIQLLIQLCTELNLLSENGEVLILFSSNPIGKICVAKTQFLYVIVGFLLMFI